MRHRSKAHSFGRRQGPRLALIKGLVCNLVENGRIKTTLARAKEVRRHVEKAVTLGKTETLNSRRLLMARLGNEKAVGLLTSDLAKRFKKRPGGYTRIIKIGARPGDSADIAFLEFVDFKPEKSTAEEVKGNKDAAKLGKAKAVLAQKHRKRLRTLQSAARRV